MSTPSPHPSGSRSSQSVNVIIKPGGLVTLAVLVAIVVSTIAFLITRLHSQNRGITAAVASTTAGQTVATNADIARINGSFERPNPEDVTKADGWEPGSPNSYTLDSAVSHSGRAAIRCENSGPVGDGGCRYRLFLYQKTPRPVEISAWSKAQNVSGIADSDYAIYVDTEFMDGTYEWGDNIPFSVGTHDWERKSLVIEPKKPIRHCKIHVLFRKAHQGTVWFDDVACKAL